MPTEREAREVISQGIDAQCNKHSLQVYMYQKKCVGVMYTIAKYRKRISWYWQYLILIIRDVVQRAE